MLACFNRKALLCLQGNGVLRYLCLTFEQLERVYAKNKQMNFESSQDKKAIYAHEGFVKPGLSFE